jgi:hypothetical protein
MSYLNELLTGYQQGVARDPSQPIEAVHAALAKADNPRQRGILLGLLAKILARPQKMALPHE